MNKPSVSHFKPNFKPLGFTAPSWQMPSYLAKIHAHIEKHPLYQKIRGGAWKEPAKKNKVG